MNCSESEHSALQENYLKLVSDSTEMTEEFQKRLAPSGKSGFFLTKESVY